MRFLQLKGQGTWIKIFQGFHHDFLGPWGFLLGAGHLGADNLRWKFSRAMLEQVKFSVYGLKKVADSSFLPLSFDTTLRSELPRPRVHLAGFCEKNFGGNEPRGSPCTIPCSSDCTLTRSCGELFCKSGQ